MKIFPLLWCMLMYIQWNLILQSVNFLKGSNLQEKLKIYITSWKSLQRGSGVCLHVDYVYVLICMQMKVKIPSLNREAAQTEGLRFGFWMKKLREPPMTHHNHDATMTTKNNPKSHNDHNQNPNLNPMTHTSRSSSKPKPKAIVLILHKSKPKPIQPPLCSSIATVTQSYRQSELEWEIRETDKDREHERRESVCAWEIT